MKLATLLCTTTLAASIAAPCAAIPVQGTLTDDNSFNGYMGSMTNIQPLSGSVQVPDSAFVFCIVGSAHWAGAGATHQYDLGDSFAPFVVSAENAAGAAKATGLLNYMVDHYYAPLISGAYGSDSGYGFNEAVWELTSDFTGQLSSLDTTKGGSYASDSDDPADTVLYTTIIKDLRQNFDTIAPSYRSSQYSVQFLTESDSTYQSLGMVTEKAVSPVPEPSSLALMLAGGMGMALCASRRKRAV